jgi:hypothetical protein
MNVVLSCSRLIYGKSETMTSEDLLAEIDMPLSSLAAATACRSSVGPEKASSMFMKGVSCSSF